MGWGPMLFGQPAVLQRVLTTDPAMGVFRHADAGYEDAQQFAAEAGVVVPHAQKS